MRLPHVAAASVGAALAAAALSGATTATAARTIPVSDNVVAIACTKATLQRVFAKERAALLTWAPRFALGRLPGLRATISSALGPTCSSAPGLVLASFTTTAAPASITTRQFRSIVQAFLVLGGAMGPPVVGGGASFTLQATRSRPAVCFGTGVVRGADGGVIRVTYGLFCGRLAGSVALRRSETRAQLAIAAANLDAAIATAAASWHHARR